MPGKSPRRSVFVCLADQLRAFEVGCYGDEVIHTPNIDRLAKEGVQFLTAVTNNPVCTPARSSLLTGQHSRSRTGTVGNVHDERAIRERVRLLDTTLAEALHEQGYCTTVIGKWHIDPEPTLVGFDSAAYPLMEHRYYGQTYFDDPGSQGIVVEEFGPHYEGRLVERFLSERQETPFLSYYSVSQPHPPIGPPNMPDEYCSMYDPESMPLRPNTIIDGQPSQDTEWYKIYTVWDYWWRVHWLKQPPRRGDDLSEGIDLRRLTA